MKILQVIPSYKKVCGVFFFACNLEFHLQKEGLDIETAECFRDGYDLYLVHYIKPFYGSDILQFRANSSKRVVLFFHHERHREHWTRGLAEGYIAMNEGILRQCKERKLIVPLPAFVQDLRNREELKKQYGLENRFTIGSNGFVCKKRCFVKIVDQLLADTDCFVDLLATRHHEWDHVDIENQLYLRMNDNPDRFRCDFSKLSHSDLNYRLQACDLLWCWTDTASSSYGSAVASDHFGSGTRMILPNLSQHKHVFRNQNVVVTEPSLDQFIKVLIAEANAGHNTRHDPQMLSWDAISPKIALFLNQTPSRMKML